MAAVLIGGVYVDFDKGSGTLGDPYYQSGIVRLSGTILTLNTNVTGSNWVTFSSNTCKLFEISNHSDADIEYQRGTTGATMIIPSGTAKTIIGLTDTNQVRFRRVDQSAVVVTIHAEYFN